MPILPPGTLPAQSDCDDEKDLTPPYMDLRFILIRAGVPFVTAMNMTSASVISMCAALLRSEEPLTMERLTLCKMGLNDHAGTHWEPRLSFAGGEQIPANIVREIQSFTEQAIQQVRRVDRNRLLLRQDGGSDQ